MHVYNYLPQTNLMNQPHLEEETVCALQHNCHYVSVINQTNTIIVQRSCNREG